MLSHRSQTQRVSTIWFDSKRKPIRYDDWLSWGGDFCFRFCMWGPWKSPSHSNKYAEHTKKAISLLGFIKEGRTQGTLLLPKLEIGKCKESWLTRTKTSGNHLSNQCCGRKIWTVISELLEAQRGQLLRVKDSRGTQSKARTHNI